MQASCVVVDPPRPVPALELGATGLDFGSLASWLQAQLPAQLPPHILYALLLSSAAAGVPGTERIQARRCRCCLCLVGS